MLYLITHKTHPRCDFLESLVKSYMCVSSYFFTNTEGDLMLPVPQRELSLPMSLMHTHVLRRLDRQSPSSTAGRELALPGAYDKCAFTAYLRRNSHSNAALSLDQVQIC